MLTLLEGYTYLGYQYTCVPPPGVSEEPILRRRLREIDSRLRLFWVNKAWMSPTFGRIRATFAVTAYEDPYWNSEHEPLQGVLLPTVSDGIGSYHGPFRCASVLDGLEREAYARGIPADQVVSAANTWRNQGWVGSYFALHELLPEAREKAWWARNRVEKARDGAGAKLLGKQFQDEILAKEQVSRKRLKDPIVADIKEGYLQDKRAAGAGDHVFVNNTSAWSPLEGAGS